jgi:hypothetical protein
MATERSYILSYLAGIILALFYSASSAGVYTGFEADSDDKRLYFIGAQTNAPLFVNVFVGHLKYKFDENDSTVDVKSTFITPTVGYRFTITDPLTVSIAAGATWEEKTEDRNNGDDTDTSTGAFAQIGASYWKADKNYEFLASYSDPTEFIWSRLRGKHRVHGQYFLGGEAFWMGNEDFDSVGAGALFEIRGERVATTFKLGVSDTSTDDTGVYGGLEFSLPF